MQSSLWKATALAGVVGIGCLIVLQAQNGLKNDENQSTANAKQKTDQDNSDLAQDDSNNWVPDQQDEPILDKDGNEREVLGPMNIAELDQLTAHSANRTTSVDSSFFDDQETTQEKPANLFAPPSDSDNSGKSPGGTPAIKADLSKQHSNKSAPSLLADTGNGLLVGDAKDAVFDKFDDAAPANAIQEMPIAPYLSKDQTDTAENDLYPEFNSDDAKTGETPTLVDGKENPFASEAPNLLAGDSTGADDKPFFDTSDANDPTAQAQKLLLDARKAMRSGDYKQARVLALEADKLDAKYGPLDDQPRLVIRDLEAIVAKQLNASPLFDEAGTVKENESGIIPVAGVLPDDNDPPKTLDKKEEKTDPFTNQANSLLEEPKITIGERTLDLENEKPLSEKPLEEKPLISVEDPQSQLADESPFGNDKVKSDNEIKLLPDNPPKLLESPAKLVDDESNKQDGLLEPSQLIDDSPKLSEEPANSLFDEKPAIIGEQPATLLDEKSALGPFDEKPNNLLESPFGKSDQSTTQSLDKSANEGSPIEQPSTLNNSLLDNPIQGSSSDVGAESPLIETPTKQDSTVPNTTTSANTQIVEEPSQDKKEVRGDGVIPKNGPGAEQRPELTIEKVAPKQATLGKPMIYSIVISNRGTANAAKVSVEDVIPKGCKLVGTIPQAELIDSKLIWRLGRLAASQQKKIHVKVIPLEEGEIGSVATVNFVAEVAARTNVKQPPRASIRVTATAPNQAQVGETLKLHFKIENTGRLDATQMVLQDLIPKGFSHPAGNDLTYEIGEIKAGQYVDVDLELKALAAGTYVNRAIVKQDGDPRTESKATIKVVDARGLSVKAVPTRAGLVGQKMKHTFKVSNASSSTVSNGTATVKLPSEVRFVSADNGGRYDQLDHSVRWQLDPMSSNSSLTLSSTVVPTSFGNYSATVQVETPGAPMNQVSTPITARGIGALAINLSKVPATVTPGETFTVEAQITNRGTGPDSNVQFAIGLPSGLEFVSARGPVKNEIIQTVQGQKIVPFTAIPEIGEKAAANFEITLRARTGGRPKLRAEVQSDQLTEAVATEAAIVVLDAQ